MKYHANSCMIPKRSIQGEVVKQHMKLFYSFREIRIIKSVREREKERDRQRKEEREKKVKMNGRKKGEKV